MTRVQAPPWISELRASGVVVAALLAGCGFSVTTQSTDEPAEEVPDAGPSARRCGDVSDPSLMLCLDFDTDPISDGAGRQSDPLVSGVTPAVRDTEPAAQLTASSIIQIAESPDLDLLTSMTLEMWMRPDLPTHDFYLLDNNAQYSLKYNSDGKVQCSLAGGPSATSIALPPGAWYHVGCTYDGATMKVYVNGELAKCDHSTAAISVAGTLGTSIGVNANPGAAAGLALYKDHFAGLLDDVHVFSRARSADEMCAAAGKTVCLLTACLR